MKKYILWILAAMGTVSCGGVVNTNLGIRSGATTYPALGPNMAILHQKNLEETIERSVVNQEKDERVKWNLIQHATPHY